MPRFNDRSSGQSQKDGRSRLKKPSAARKCPITLNPYVCSPERALRLMGRICTASTSDRHIQLQTEIDNLLNQKGFDSQIDEQRSALHNFDLKADVHDALGQLVTALESEAFSNVPRTKVAVAGIYNAGKSSMLNHLVKREKLLPEDNVPATVVPAFLYCQRDIDDIAVYGVNKANAIVPLDTEVLNCISHSVPGEDALRINTAEQIAKALSHFIVELKHPEFEQIVFIDTPGYGNTQTDKNDTLVADKYTEQADMVLWLVSAASGALGKDEWALIDAYAPKRVVIVLTKADLLGKDALEDVYHSTVEESRQHSHVKDVVRMSVVEGKEGLYKSRSGASLNAILKVQTMCISKKTAVDSAEMHLLSILDTELEKQENRINELNKKFVSLKHAQNAMHKRSLDIQNEFKRLLAYIKETMIDDYEAIISHIKSMISLTEDLTTNEYKYFNKVVAYYNGRISKPSDVESIIDEWRPGLEKLGERYNSLASTMPKYYNREIRESFVTSVHRTGADVMKALENEINSTGEKCGMIDTQIGEAEHLKNYIKFLRHELLNWLKDKKANLGHVEYTKTDKSAKIDMFEAIKSNDIDLLLDCFIKPHDVATEYDSDGRSALTLAAHCGNIDALRLFGAQNMVDLSAPDRLGLTPYLSAIANMQLTAAQWLKKKYPECTLYTSMDGRSADDILNEAITGLSYNQKPEL